MERNRQPMACGYWIRSAKSYVFATSIRTEQAYVQWVQRFILFSRQAHPYDMGGEKLAAFLNHLASRRNVAASTQNQALNAILFLYRDVLKIKLPWLDDSSEPRSSSACQ